MSQVTLAKAEYRKKLCPFETVKTWKSGSVIRCPRVVELFRGKNAEDDSFILHELEVKRECECHKCLKTLIQSIQTVGKKPNEN